MEINWINHAGFSLIYKDIHLVTDPWIEGRVFNESWDLLAESRFTYDDFAHVTHIWFSHEHPDHFFPPNLKKIDRKHRSGITI